MEQLMVLTSAGNNRDVRGDRGSFDGATLEGAFRGNETTVSKVAMQRLRNFLWKVTLETLCARRRNSGRWRFVCWTVEEPKPRERSANPETNDDSSGLVFVLCAVVSMKRTQRPRYRLSVLLLAVSTVKVLADAKGKAKARTDVFFEFELE